MRAPDGSHRQRTDISYVGAKVTCRGEPIEEIQQKGGRGMDSNNYDMIQHMGQGAR